MLLLRSIIKRDGSRVTDRSVFAQLAERGESFLVGLANPVDHLLSIRTQHIVLYALRLLLVLFLLVPVIPHSWKNII